MTTAHPVRLNGRYRLDQRIGAGGMGEVWRATDEVLGRVVAVKTVLPSLVSEADFSRRFLAEARAMASVHHPGVVAIHDFHSGANDAFLVMEFVDGEPLSRVLARLGRLAPTAALHLVGQAADALHAAHVRGITHRDVKPGNLLVRPDGTLLLTDFGIARRDGATALTATGAVIGTLSYLAPEQVLGHPATARSDIYALGVVAYECLTGRRPFTGDNPFAVAMQRVNQAPPPLDSDVPEAVVALVERALAVDPAARWPTAAAFGSAIAQVVASLPRGAAPSGPSPTIVDPSRVRPTAADSPPVHPTVTDPAPARPTVVDPRAGHQTIVESRPGPPAAVEPAGLSPTTPDPYLAGTRQAVPADGQVPQAESPVPPGFARWGELYVPAQPMCWGGLVIPGGLGRTPRRISPDEPHYWETFAAAVLPEEAIYLRQEELIEHPAIAAICSARILAARSRDPARTAGWELEPWPVQVGRDTWIFHCLAAPGTGEWLGTEFAWPGT